MTEMYIPTVKNENTKTSEIVQFSLPHQIKFIYIQAEPCKKSS